ncbi:MAG: hypothetical protein SPI30_09915 [Prevotella sp.]|nr:hypothetical protein [Prevotella sp.]
MKKLLLVIGCILALAGCKDDKKAMEALQKQQADSLQRIIAQRDNEINDMMGTLNEIQEGFRLINEAEDRVSLAKDGEGANKARQIKENMAFIQSRMQQNRELINKLRQQIREGSVKSDALKRTIEGMVKQLEEKDKQLQALREELDSKDIHISSLNENINNLNTNVENLKTESSQKSQTISTQDKQLHTAWYVFGTKSELKEQNILVKGDVLRGNFNKNYFSKIDIRVDKEIKLYSKSANILTDHPAGSYTLTRDANKQYVLRITNPQQFWSVSKYLVVLVK